MGTVNIFEISDLNHLQPIAIFPSILSGALLRSATVFEPPAIIAGLDDIAMLSDAIEKRGDLRIAKNVRPLAEREIGGGDYQCSFVKFADEVEQWLAT